MADTVTTSNYLSMSMEFGDGSQKSLTYDDPIDDETELVSKVNELSQFIATNQLILGSESSSFTRIRAAKIMDRQVTDLGINVNT